MAPRILLVVALVAVARLALADAAIPGEPAPSAGDEPILRCARRLERLRAELAVRYPFFASGTILPNRRGVTWQTVGPQKPWQAGGVRESYVARFEREATKSGRKPTWDGMRVAVTGGPPSLGFSRATRGFSAAVSGEGNAIDDFARVAQAELDRCLTDED